MNYFSKNKKWMAYLILLTFLFTSIIPTNLATGDSMAYAASGTVTYEKANGVQHGKDYVIVYNNQYVLKWNGSAFTVADNVEMSTDKSSLTVKNQEQNNVLWTITTRDDVTERNGTKFVPMEDFPG